MVFFFSGELEKLGCKRILWNQPYLFISAKIQMINMRRIPKDLQLRMWMM